MVIPQNKFLHLVHPVLKTTWYTFNSQFYQQTDGVAMEGPASSTRVEIISRFMNVLHYLQHYTLQSLGTIC